MATPIEVGRFTLDENNDLRGPAEYLREQGNAKLAAMIDGRDPAFEVALRYQPDFRLCLLVMLQTDYAAWAGSRQLLAALDR